MNAQTAIIITSINSSENKILQSYATECKNRGVNLIIAGDIKTPTPFELKGCEYLDIKTQKNLPFQLPKLLPENHYSRKNAAYLQAIKKGNKIIIDTDDDNLPLPEFWNERNIKVRGDGITHQGWINVYSFFSETDVWPRGYALNHLAENHPWNVQSGSVAICPIQQSLADGNPDVDAIFRLSSPLPIYFNKREPVILNAGSICPFNSQNTTWFEAAFPLLYIPSYCSFRMCDIWRSFIAQRILWANNWKLSFHNANVVQHRNEHNLLKDLEEEIEGYVYNEKIIADLMALSLEPGPENISANLRKCYEMMVKYEYFPAEELKLLNAWLEDLRSFPLGH
jgi:hypothetical protein